LVSNRGKTFPREGGETGSGPRPDGLEPKAGDRDEAEWAGEVSGGPEPSVPSEVGAGIDGPTIFSLGEVTTVFDPAWDLLKAGRLPVWGSILAESQTQGRGRAGRLWRSPPGHIYAALRLPDKAPFEGPASSICLALLVSLALEELYRLRLLIKWPNDLILEGKKIGGLLLEARLGAVIAGIGLNLGSPPPGARTPGDMQPPPAGALPVPDQPSGLWPKLVEKMLACYNFIMGDPAQVQTGAQVFLRMSTERLLGLGQLVTVSSPSSEPPFHGQDLAGRLIGLDSSGALLIEKDRSRYAVWSGSLFFDFKIPL
jgi:BirA family biotin operon repressor/biotin-[acetyl-CoA-carboxylase] ligase